MEKILSITDHEIVGSKGILIKLFPYPTDSTINSAGIIVPLYENYESDGGRPASRITTENFSNIGEVIQISSKAQQYLEEEKMDIKVGDIVSIGREHKHPSNQFLPKNVQTQHPSDYEGYMIVHFNAIQSKIKNN